MFITVKNARKHQRREYEQKSAAQLEKICQHLEGWIHPNESPAMAVKRLLARLEELGVDKPPVLEKVPLHMLESAP